MTPPPLQPRHADCEQARRRVMRHGRTTTAYAILNPGILHWFDDECDAVAGYVRRGAWWIVAGDPVCEPSDLPRVVERIRRAAAREGRQVIYVVCSEAMRQATALANVHPAVVMGAEPIWRPDGWAGRVRSISSLRAQLNRARNKGVTIEPLAIEDVPSARRELRGVIDDWLLHRPLPPLRFLVEPMAIDGVLDDRQIFVARCCGRQGGKAIAFLLASPVPQRNGWLVEQICRRRDAPNGTSELLIDHAMRAWAEQGAAYATLGLVILTPLAGPAAHQPWWVRLAFAFARVHGRRFYNFDGLERFRVKMRPDAWEPMSIITPGRPPSLAGFYAAGAAFCGQRSPASLVAEGASKALRTDGRRFVDWIGGDRG